MKMPDISSMDVKAYLQRLKLKGSVEDIIADVPTLFRLHESHVFAIPFEGLDIQLKRAIELNINLLFKKVIIDNRGGFCYELNYIFYKLLETLGFDAHLISASIINGDSSGPPFDHMAIIVKEKKQWLLDVGYGDLFLKPLLIEPEIIQTDGRSFFKLERIDKTHYLLWMSADKKKFEKRYIFNLLPQSIDNFIQPCKDKQENPDSYFVKNLVCTKPTTEGRLTIFNTKLISTTGVLKEVIDIETNEQLKEILLNHFDIRLNASIRSLLN